MIRKFCKSMKTYPVCCGAIAVMFLLAILALDEKAYIVSVFMAGTSVLIWNVLFGKRFDSFIQALKYECKKTAGRKDYEKNLPESLLP